MKPSLKHPIPFKKHQKWSTESLEILKELRKKHTLKEMSYILGRPQSSISKGIKMLSEENNDKTILTKKEMKQILEDPKNRQLVFDLFKEKEETIKQCEALINEAKTLTKKQKNKYKITGTISTWEEEIIEKKCEIAVKAGALDKVTTLIKNNERWVPIIALAKILNIESEKEYKTLEKTIEKKEYYREEPSSTNELEGTEIENMKCVEINSLIKQYK